MLTPKIRASPCVDILPGLRDRTDIMINGFVQVDVEFELCGNDAVERLKPGIFDNLGPLVKTVA